MIDIENLKPFPKFCYTIGMIPTSYKESLTYEEQLIWFCSFLQDTVIPTVNNNGQAVTELQNLYVELKNYVDTYFENLDVQEEINNKLDEMAESGVLTNLIKNYVDPIFNDFKNQINGEISSQNSNISNINNNLNTLEARVDNLSNLEEGSTTGDAELTDGRISFDGLTYSNIGNNIRSSDEKINNRLNTYINTNIVENMIFQTGVIYSNGSVNQSASSYKTTDFINVTPGEKLYFKTARAICWFNNSSPVSYEDILSQYAKDLYITVPDNVNKCRITFNINNPIFVCKTNDDITDNMKNKVLNTIGYIPNMLYDLPINQGFFTNGVSRPDGVSYNYYSNIKVKANHTYKVYPRVRFVSYYKGETSHILESDFDINASASAGAQSFTPPEDGYVFITVYAEDYNNGLCKMYDITDNEIIYPVNGRVIDKTFCFNQETIDYIKSKTEGSPLKNIKIYNFGDSIGAGDGNNGIGYAELLQRLYETISTDYAIGGSTLSFIENQTMQSILNHIENADTNAPDIILLEGGANDYTQYREMGQMTNEFEFDNTNFDITTYIGALEMAFYKLKTKYPNTPIIWIYTHRENTRTQKTNGSVTVNFTTMHDRSLEVCKKWSIPVIDIYNNGGLNTMLEYDREHYTYNNDGTHPNELGYVKFYLPLIKQKIIELLNL